MSSQGGLEGPKFKSGGTPIGKKNLRSMEKRTVSIKAELTNSRSQMKYSIVLVIGSGVRLGYEWIAKGRGSAPTESVVPGGPACPRILQQNSGPGYSYSERGGLGRQRPMPDCIVENPGERMKSLFSFFREIIVHKVGICLQPQ